MTESSEKITAYAQGLLSIARAEGHVDRVEDELFRFARAFEASEDLRTTLTDAAIPVDRRLSIIEDLLARRASPFTTAAVSFIVGAGRGRDLPAIADAFVAQAAELRQEAVAEVRSAVPLDADQQGRLAEALGKATGKRVTVKVIVDPSVLGGWAVRAGATGI